MSPMEFPAGGDEAVAFQISVEVDGPTERGELALVRRGSDLNLLIRLDVQAGSGPGDPGLLQRIARRADAKILQVGP
jgi:hypothetical protein